MKRWYVICVAPPPAEAFVFRALGFLGISFHQFTQIRRRPGRPPDREPVFPGYLFVELDLDEDQWKSLYGLPGVLKICSDGLGWPIPLPEGEMERLLGNFNNRSRDPAEGFVKPGDRVSMRKGPLAMFEAIVKWSDRNQVGLTFSMLGRQSSVTTTLENVQPV